MGNQQRYGVRPGALLTDEMQVDAVNRRLEMLETVEFRLMLAPIIFDHPVGAQFLHVIEIGAIFPAAVIRHFVPGKGGDAGPDIGQRFAGNVNLERGDGAHGAESLTGVRRVASASLLMRAGQSGCLWKPALPLPIC